MRLAFKPIKSYKTGIYTQKYSYATIRVNKPKPLKPEGPKTEQQALAEYNNPQVLKTDVNGNVYTTRHHEVLKSTCDQNKCKEKVCPTLCGKPSGEKDKAIGHFTTNPNHADFVVSQTVDLDKNQRTQYGKSYTKSHEIDPSNVNIHKKRSANLNQDTQALKNIKDNDFDK